MREDVTVVIPTINSGRYIDIVLSYYRDRGIQTTVFVDDGSEDDTLTVAGRYAAQAISLPNPHSFLVEGLVELISRTCRTPWLLRVDDDELPSEEMLKWVEQAIHRDDGAVYGFPRHQCAVSRSGKLVQRNTVSPLDHIQWRLYQPSRVTYCRGVHQPGFRWQGESVRAPVEANLIHLDWAVHTYEERRAKIERYDALVPNAGTRWRSYYLYEEQERAEPFFEMPLPEFDKTTQQIAERFRPLCVDV